MDVQMVALDLDGTLLSPEHTVNSDTAAYLRSLVNRGLKVCICTGRAIPAITAVVKALDFPVPIHCIAFNGAAGVTFPASPSTANICGEAFLDARLSYADTCAVLAFAEERNLVVQYYTESDIFVKRRTELTDRYHELTGCEHKEIKSYEHLLQQSLPFKLLLMTTDVDQVYSEASQIFAKQRGLYCVRGTPPFFVEVLANGINKGAGFLSLCRHLKIDPVDCIAFGDGENDIEMLKYAGVGYAMLNSSTIVQQCADRVTSKTNAQNGVMHELQDLERAGRLRLCTHARL